MFIMRNNLFCVLAVFTEHIFLLKTPSKYWFTQKLQLTACSGLFISESCLMTLRNIPTRETDSAE